MVSFNLTKLAIPQTLISNQELRKKIIMKCHTEIMWAYGKGSQTGSGNLFLTQGMTESECLNDLLSS